jgi:hypothetical protein
MIRVVTGQGLQDTDFDSFPPSLTYMYVLPRVKAEELTSSDLSFNNLEGTVPSLIQLTSLGTL